MKTALWCAVVGLLSACSIYDPPQEQVSNDEQVVGHRGGAVIHADDPPASTSVHASITGPATPQAEPAPAAEPAEAVPEAPAAQPAPAEPPAPPSSN